MVKVTKNVDLTTKVLILINKMQNSGTFIMSILPTQVTSTIHLLQCIEFRKRTIDDQAAEIEQ